jgi:hypothetical protein
MWWRGHQLELRMSARGGRRVGAGRKPGAGRRNVPHRSRPPHADRWPVHVTMRVAPGLPTLRGGRLFAAIRAALGAGSNATFRLLQFSVQRDHLHLVVEANGPTGSRAGDAGARDPCGEGVEPGTRSPRTGLGGPLSCAAPEDASRGSERVGLRAEQRPKAHPWCTWRRSVLVGALVRRLANLSGRGQRRFPGGPCANMACPRRVDARRSHRRR